MENGAAGATGPAAWTIAPARAQDRPALEALFAGCSPLTVRLRFFGRLQAIPAAYLDGVLGGRPEVHDAVVGHDGDRGGLAGVASLAAGRAGGDGAAELGVLVAEAHQRQGLGAAMIGVLLARARERDVALVSASVLPHRAPLLAALGRRPELAMVDGSVSGDARTGIYKLL
jgi:GNAT superfamily N-acetyltransferase